MSKLNLIVLLSTLPVFINLNCFAADPFRISYLIEVTNHQDFHTTKEFKIYIDQKLIEEYKDIPSSNKPYFQKIIFIKDQPLKLKLDTEEILIDLSLLPYDNQCIQNYYTFSSSSGLEFSIIFDVDDLRSFTPLLTALTTSICEGDTIFLDPACQFGNEYYSFTWQYSHNMNGPWINFDSGYDSKAFIVKPSANDFIYFRNIINNNVTDPTSQIKLLRKAPIPNLITIKPSSCNKTDDWEINISQLKYSFGNLYNPVNDGELVYTFGDDKINPDNIKTFSSFLTSIYINSPIVLPAQFKSGATHYLYIEHATYNCLTEPIEIFLPAPPPLSIDKASFNNISCYNKKDGSIDVTLKNSLLPANYQLFNSANQLISQSISNLNDFSIPVNNPGNYYLKIEDQCLDTTILIDPVSISQPDPLIPIISTSDYGLHCQGKPCNITSFGGQDTIKIELQGGTAPYLVSMSAVDYNVEAGVQLTVNNSPAGWHYFNISDHQYLTDSSRGCFIRDSIRLLQPHKLKLELLSATPPTCNQGTDGIIRFAASGGIPPDGTNRYQLHIFQPGLQQENLVTDSIINFSWNLFGGPFEYLPETPFGFVLKDKYSKSDSLVYKFPQQTDTIYLADLKVTAPTCWNGNNGRLTIHISGGYPFTSDKYDVKLWLGDQLVNSINQKNPVEFDQLSPGEYQLEINGSSCKASVFNVLVPQPPNPLDLKLTSVNQVSCYKYKDGSITLMTANGSGPFTYKVGSEINQSSDGFFLYENLEAGDYTFKVEDINHCQDSLKITINQPDQIHITFPSENVDSPTCYGIADGYIDPSIVGGTGNQIDWKFKWSNTAGYYSENKTISKLHHGLYELTVEDANNCSGKSELELLPGPVLSIDQVQTLPASCEGKADGKIIDIRTSLSHQSLQYIIDDTIFTRNYFEASLADGSHTLKATNAIGCISETYHFNIHNRISRISYSIQDSIKCYGETASLEFAVDSSASTMEFFVDSTKLTASDCTLKAGNYQVYGVSANGCTSEILYLTLDQPSALEIVNFSSEPAYCGLNNGIASGTIKGGTGKIVSTWVDQEKHVVDPGALIAGSYHLIAIDANGCTIQEKFDISEAPTPSVQINQTTPEYCDLNLGSAEITFNNGYPPFYILDQKMSYEFTFLIGNLASGDTIFQIKDSKDCVVVTEIEILEKPTLSLEIKDKQNASCGLTNGSFRLEINNGFPPYRKVSNLQNEDVYEWTKIPAGMHHITINDSLGCSSSETILISNQQVPEIKITVTEDAYCNLPNGEIMFDLKGLDPEQVRIFNQTRHLFGDGNSLLGYSPGQYFAEVSDEKGCFSYSSFIVNNEEAPDLNISVNRLPDCNTSNGSLEGHFQSISLPISYNWQSQGKDLLNHRYLDEIPSGIYYLTATDARGCARKEIFELREKSSPKFSIELIDPDYCHLKNATVKVLSDTTFFNRYYMDGILQGSEPEIKQIENGIHSFYLSNDRLCYSDTIQFFVPALPGFDLEIDIKSPDCSYGTNGAISLTPTLSDHTYQYRLDEGKWQNTPTFPGLSAGIYQVYVRDHKGCSFEKPLHITIPVPLEITASHLTSPLCYNGGDGFASFKLSGGKPPYNYRIDQTMWQATGDFRDLPGGEYNLMVQDQNGCVLKDTFQIGIPEIPQHNLNDEYLVCQGQVAIIDPGRKWQQCLWTFPNGEQLNQKLLTSSTQGTYGYQLIDQNGCSIIDSLSIATSDRLLQARILATSHAIAGDSVVILDISKPYSDFSEWDFGDALVDDIKEDNNYKIVKFNDPGDFYIRMTAHLAECRDQVNQPIIISPPYPVKTDLIDKLKFISKYAFSPNPTNGLVNMEVILLKSMAIELEVKELSSGISVYRQQYPSNLLHRYHIDLSALKKGIYLVQLKCEQEMVNTKLSIL